MPEGPEVYMLAKAFKILGFEAESCGKHLLYKDLHTGKRFDISFGLVGKIQIDSNLNITKIQNDKIPSGELKEITSFKEIKSKLGVDWLKATREDIEDIVHRWSSRKKQIGALLLDQHEISGIGIAWGSEILNTSNINPNERSSIFELLNLSTPLVDAILSTREKALKLYTNVLTANASKFINNWYTNLYTAREESMNVYKKGTEMIVSGRTFYIQKEAI